MRQSRRCLLVGALCLAVLGLVAADAYAAKTLYVRIQVDTDTTAYLAFEGTKLKVATAPDKLKRAKSVRVSRSKGGRVQYRAFKLPAAEGTDPATAQLAFITFKSRGKTMQYVGGTLTSTRKEGRTKWTYQQSIGVTLKETTPEKSPMIALADPDNLKLTVKADRFSTKAKEKIEAAGGQVELCGEQTGTES